MSISAAQQHFNDAEEFKKNGFLQEAIASYKKAIEVDAYFVSAYYNLALAYHQAQQPDQAIVNLKKTTELDPGDASAFNNLGVLYVARNRLGDAKRCFEKALSIEGDYQDARDNLEKVLQKLQKYGQHPKSRQTIQAYCRNVGFVTLWYERGQAYITKSIRDSLDSEYNTYVFARNGGTADKPLLKTTGEWDVPNLTVYPEYKIPRDVLKDWISKNYLAAVFFNEETDMGLVEAARHCGAKTIGYYIWELFDPQYVPECMLLYDKIICPTKACFEKFKNLGLTNVEYIQWGVDLNVFKPKERLDNKRIKFFHPAGWGGIHARRGTQFVIDAFQKLNAPNTELLIHTQYGFGVQEDKNIKILFGTVPREEIVRMYQESDVAVLPSKWEGLGLTFLESIGCGLPIITVDAPPMNEFVHNGETGFLCRIAERKRYQGIFVDGVDVDIDDMAEKMKMMLDTSLRSVMQENVKTFASDFSITKFNENVRNLFFDVVKRGGENRWGYKKILIVGVLDVASSTNLFMKKGFEKLELQVDSYSYRTRIKELGSLQAMWEDFRRFLDGKRYELIVFCKVNGMHPELITYAGQHGKTWYWFMDHLGVAREIHADEYVRRADFASATSEEVCNWFRGLNLKTFHLIEGFDPDTYFHEDIPKIYDVLFFGNATEKRINDLRILRNNQALTIFGSGWPQDFSAKPPIYNEALRTAICQSKIVLNLVHANIFSDRVILAVASGGFVLSQFCADLEKFFHRKHHVDWFQTVKEAQQLIRYYLEHDAERENIAQRGMNYVRQKHDWGSVCKDILQKLDEYSTKEIAIPQGNIGERVLFVSWHGLGDNVMLTPALRKYKQKNPNCYIGVAGLERFGEILVQLLSGLSFVDEVIPCLPDAWNGFPDYKTGVVAVVQRAQTIGKEKGFSKIIILPTNRQEGYKLHKIFRFADEVGVEFGSMDELQTELYVKSEKDSVVKEFISLFRRPILILHTKAGNQQKTPSSEFVESIIADYKDYIVFEFGRNSTKRSIELGENDMELTKALIKNADQVIAIDSVVMHIAGAFQRPCLAIFTHTPIHQAIPLTYPVNYVTNKSELVQEEDYKKAREEIKRIYGLQKIPIYPQLKHYVNIQKSVEKVSKKYYDQNAYWAAFLTLRCTSDCVYCIQRIDKDTFKKAMNGYSMLSGDQWVSFLNGLYHPEGRPLSIIGGEPTIHPDFVKILNGLEGYMVTVTTNLKSEFYKDLKRSIESLKPKCPIRFNTSFHPNLISAKEFCSRILQMKGAGLWVDQIAMVDHPGSQFENYKSVFSQYGIRLTAQSLLGYWDGQLYPGTNELGVKNDPREHGITDMVRYRDGFSAKIHRPMLCSTKRFLIAPDGTVYNCHYHLYSRSNSHCGKLTDNSVTLPEDFFLCEDYGFCNPCDYPHVIFKQPEQSAQLDKFCGTPYEPRDTTAGIMCPKITATDFGMNKCTFCGTDLELPIVLDMMRCKNCGIYRKYQIPTKENIREYLKGMMLSACYDKGKETSRMQEAEYQLDLLQKHLQPGRLFDVGAAGGFFMKAARDRGWQVAGNEISLMAIQWAKQRYDLEIMYGFLEELEHPQGFYDAVVLWHSLEHTIDPRETLVICRNMLVDGGVLMIGVPEKKGADIVKRYEPLHFYEFNRDNLHWFLKELGFESLEIVIREEGDDPQINVLYLKKRGIQ